MSVNPSKADVTRMPEGYVELVVHAMNRPIYVKDALLRMRFENGQTAATYDNDVVGCELSAVDVGLEVKADHLS